MVLMALLALALPVAAFANSSVDFTNSGGTLSGSSSLTLSGSTLVVVNGLNGGGLIAGNLGTISFTTGTLTSGSLAGGGTFAAGGSFTVTGNGTNGIPNGVIFSGTFSEPVQWILVDAGTNNAHYILTGSVSGMLGGSFVTVGVTTQLTKPGVFNGSIGGSSGDTNIVTPEPGTLGLLGTGLLGIAGVVRRKLNIG